MKNSTKFKIIKWVEKMLKYQQPIQLAPISDTRKIQEVRWEKSFDKDRPVEKDKLKYIIAQSIAFEIEKRGLIQIKESIKYGKKIVRARAFFIKPLET